MKIIMTPKTTLVVISLLALAAATNVPLLRLRSHWTGNGVSHYLPDTLRVLSEKLDAQCGLMSSYSALPGGKQWSLTATVSLRCKNYDAVGIGLFFSTNQPVVYNSEYSCERVADTFGMTPEIRGTGLLFFNNNLYAGQYNNTDISREHLTLHAKTCKASLRTNKEVTVSVRNRMGNISIYLIDPKT